MKFLSNSKSKILLLLFFIASVIVSLYLELSHEIISFFYKSDVLQAATTAQDSFGVFSQVTIDQYPTISYTDTGIVPFQNRFSNYRNVASKTRFTHYLCSGTPSSCAGYNQTPKFVRLRFDGSEKLMLFNFYGLFSIDDSANSIKWESTHIDRFLTANTNSFSNCSYKYDPASVVPVKNGNTYYLFSKFKGLNNRSCLQFYDNTAKTPSFSGANGELVLGYEVNSNGQLNRNYNRTGSLYRNVTPGNEGPFGPGPQNSVTYSTSPLADVVGCKQFDSSKRCINSQGLASNTYNYVPQTSRTEKYNCRIEKYAATCPFLTCQAFTDTRTCSAYQSTPFTYWFKNCSYPQPGTSDCTWQSDIRYENVCVQWETTTSTRFYNVLGNPNSTGSLCSPNNHVYTSWVNCTLSRTVCDTRTIVTPSTFKASLVAPTFSNFNNFSFNPANWNVSGGGIPADYNKFSDELSVNSTDNAINFTQDYNKSIFVTNNYIYKLSVTSRDLTIKRYTLNTNSYDIGGTSYINGSSVKSVTVNIKNTANTNYSLDYIGNDILVMASGSNTPAFYRIKGFNSESAFTTVDLFPEVIRKLPLNTSGVLKTFGIVQNGTSSKIFIVTDFQAFWANIEGTISVTVVDTSYKNFEFNGNVFSKENLTSGFMFTAPASKFIGSYVTSEQFTSNLKFLNSSTLTFNYPNTLLSSLLNFSSFNGTTFNKYNFLYTDVNYTENVPLTDSQYLTFSNPTSTNNLEVIYVSEGRGVKIDLTNQNIIKNFNKYVIVNSDKNNRSRINFYLNCASASYSLICSGVKFNFKGALLGQFYISGNTNTAIADKRFIRIHENADILINLVSDLRSKKYQTITSTIVNLKYE